MLTTESKLEQSGSSQSSCDYILMKQMERIKPRTIVDFGAGGGKVGRIARRVLNDEVRLIAVEGFEETVSKLKADGVYDEVIHELIQKWDIVNQSHFDLAIFGDVLEHLRPKEIHALLKRCIKIFDHIVIICPLHDIFQGSSYGNHLEIHQSYITANFFDRYKPIEKHLQISGRYTMMNVHITHKQSPPLYRRIAWNVFHNAVLVLQPIGLASPLANAFRRHARKYKWILFD